MEIIYVDTQKDISSDKLHKLFVLVGWSDGLETTEMLQNYNVPFKNSTIVISAWKEERLVGVVRVISDKMFRSVIYDLIVDPEFQNQGIGSSLVKRCIEFYPKSEWLVGTTKDISAYYEKLGFEKISVNDVYLSIPCKLFG